MKQIPFARWENFQACVNEQLETGHDEESAKKICGAIQARAEKGMLFKAEPYELDIISKGDDLVVGGYSTWELRDPQNDIITTQAQTGFLKRLFALPMEYQNITVKHGDFKIGTPLLKYTAKDGKEYFSHVNEKGTYLLSKIRNDNFKSTRLWRDKILNGELAMYSISGLPLESEMIRENGEEIRKVLDLEPWAITLCERGINPKAHTQIISKQEEGEKPPKDWWDACIASVEGADPAAVCGHIFHHVLGGDRSRADPAMFKSWPKTKAKINTNSVLKTEVEELLQKHGFNKTVRRGE